jgi:hypothetical protein
VVKDTLDNDCVDLPAEDGFVVSVLTVAAPMWPVLTPDEKFAKLEDMRDLRGKIRLFYRMAAANGQESLVLGESLSGCSESVATLWPLATQPAQFQMCSSVSPTTNTPPPHPTNIWS